MQAASDRCPVGSLGAVRSGHWVRAGKFVDLVVCVAAGCSVGDAQNALENLNVVLHQVATSTDMQQVPLGVPQPPEVPCTHSNAAPHLDHRIDFYLTRSLCHLRLLSKGVDAKLEHWRIQ